MRIIAKNGGLLDRALSGLGLVRSSRAEGQGSSDHRSSYAAAGHNRLNWDWATSILSADQEIRYSLRTMRARSRQLSRDNGHALRFFNAARKNVIGPTGVKLEISLEDNDSVNEAIELAWLRWSRSVTADGRATMTDACNLWLETLLKDGEVFVRKVRGYPGRFGFALEFIDADRVDWLYDRRRVVASDGSVTNEIRMGIEIDEWHRPVAYHVLQYHPTEIYAGRNYLRIPAEEIDHAYLFRRAQQTRGVPFLHAAMSALNMLGGLEEAELVSSRMEACKGGYFTSKTGENDMPKPRDASGKPITVDQSPGYWLELPPGVMPVANDPNHPNSAFPEFRKALLHGVAMAAGCSYATLSGDLRDVNFSSLRQGVLDERDDWRVLQTFAIEHFLVPLFADWLAMAMLSGELRIPLPPVNQPDYYLDAITWTARGWLWVDPFKDIQADVMAMRAGLRTAQAVCAGQGLDYREVYEQRAKEIALAKELGIPIDLGGAGERAPQTIDEGGTPDPNQPTAPAQAPAPPPQRKNGKAANADFPEIISTLRGADPDEEVQ